MKTIVALATAPMNSAIHIIRISGDEAYNIVNKITTKKVIKTGYKVVRNQIKDNNKIIDDVLILTFVKPQSYTGEDLIEINCHGGYYLANKIISLLIKNGGVQAQPGEFTKRAYLNNKISLNKAGAINNLILASNDKSIDLANLGFNSNLNNLLTSLSKKLFELIGQVEVNIDYPEFDDVPNITINKFKKILYEIITSLTTLIDNSKRISKFRDGINVAIIGKPNVGKSSLLNAILNEERVIVSNIPGTTRDIVDAKVNIRNITFNFIDTAGIHLTKNYIEKLGIKKSTDAINKADMVLLVLDNSKKINNEDKSIINLLKNRNTIVVLNKSDLKQVNNIDGVKISAKNKKINNLLNAIVKNIKLSSFNANDGAFLQSNYLINQLNEALNNLIKAQELVIKKQPIDLSMEYLHEAWNKMILLISDKKNIEFIDEMFKNFCVGK